MFACERPIAIISSKNTTVEKVQIPEKEGAISKVGNLFSQSGSFKAPEKEGDVEPKPVSIGPFSVTTGGKLDARIVGTPAVPNNWSMGNWNSALTVYYQSVLDSSPREILKLSGQLEQNDLSGIAEWSGPGWITAVITPAWGTGVFNSSYFDQSYQATVNITALNKVMSGWAGTKLDSTDMLKTASDGSAFVALPNGHTAFIGNDSELLVTGQTAASTAPLPPSAVVAVQTKLKEYMDYQLPVPEDVTADNIDVFLNSFSDRTLDGALQLMETTDDPYEAALLTKLYLEANRGEWTTAKIANTLHEVAGPDGYTVLEEIAKKVAPKAVPIAGVFSVADDLKSAIELIDEELTASETKSVYSTILNSLKNTKGSSTIKLQNILNEQQQELAKVENKLFQLYDEWLKSE